MIEERGRPRAARQHGGTGPGSGGDSGGWSGGDPGAALGGGSGAGFGAGAGEEAAEGFDGGSGEDPGGEGRSPGRWAVSGSAGARSRGEFAARLREGAADRLPPGLRQGPGVPRAAALAALAIALVLAAALVSRAGGGGSGEITVPGAMTPGHRPGTAQGAGQGARPSHSAVPGGGGLVTAAGEVVPGWPGAVPGPATGGVPPGATLPAASGTEVVVDVSGRVRRAGLVRLAAGSRVWDAVVAAGGPAASARLDRLNLARRLTDGEQVFVPGPNDPVPLQLPVAAGAGAPGASAADPGVPAAPVDLNTATAQQLDSLPGVGPVLAQRILAWRAQHGRFSRAEELGEVPGIGDKLFAQLRPRVQV